MSISPNFSKLPINLDTGELVSEARDFSLSTSKLPALYNCSSCSRALLKRSPVHNESNTTDTLLALSVSSSN